MTEMKSQRRERERERERKMEEEKMLTNIQREIR